MAIDAVKTNTKVRFDEFGFWVKSFQADNRNIFCWRRIWWKHKEERER